MTRPLPGDLAPPLHILEPFPLGAVLLVAALAGLLALLVMWRKRRKRAPSPATSPPRAMVRPAPGFASEIRELYTRHLVAQSYREGCYELTELSRDRWRKAGHLRSATRTAREVHRERGDTALSQLLLMLAKLRFGSIEPGAEAFQQACDTAIEVDRSLSGSREK